MNTSTEHLKELTAKLVAMGEDKNQMHFWEQIFEDMSPQEKTKLIDTLEKELAELEKL